jgi:guanylate kinase
VFILPPSVQALEQRLRARGKDSEAVIAARMAAAESEIAHANEFEYVIINQEFTDALQQISQIIASARLKFSRQAMTHRDLFDAMGLST